MTTERLHRFCELVQKWSPRINLVSRSDLSVLWERHVEDSLSLIPFIPPGTMRAIDLGSGAGFPGLVLALETGIDFTLIESDARKAAFLSEAARQLAAPVRVLNTRIETARLDPAPLVTARALAPLEKLLALAHPLLAPEGICLFPKGPAAGSELTAARRLWHFAAERHEVPPAADQKCILKVSLLRHAGS